MYAFLLFYYLLLIKYIFITEFMRDINKFYALNKIDDIVGNEATIKSMKLFAEDINQKKKKRALLLSGPPGTGKTISVYLLAKQYNWNLIELSASDYRNAEAISKLSIAANTRSIFGKMNLIFFDEIDEMAPKFDKGAVPELTKLLNNTKMPIIFTANDRWNKNISFLRTKTEPLEFKKLSEKEIIRALDGIINRLELKKEFNIDNKMLDFISKISKGDARSAINDLFTLLGSPENIMYDIGLRDKKSNIFEVLDKIFFSNTLTAPLAAISRVDVDNNMLINWLEQNIPNKYIDNEDRYNAFNMLSNASIFYSRAIRSQYFTYWRYMNVFMSSGIALSKKHYPSTIKRYEFPKQILELSSSKTERGIKNIIAEKLKKRIHLNKKRIINEEMKLIAYIVSSYKNKEEMNEFLINNLRLEQKEIEWLKEFKNN